MREVCESSHCSAKEVEEFERPLARCRAYGLAGLPVRYDGRAVAAEQGHR